VHRGEAGELRDRAALLRARDRVPAASGRDGAGGGAAVREASWVSVEQQLVLTLVSGVVVQINVSPGGMPKLPGLFAQVSKHGLDGDRQKNLKYHGGPDRAICLFSEELYGELREEGVELVNGAVGENFTTRGVDLKAMKVGDRMRVGECLIEITDVRKPCRSLNQWHPKLLGMMKGRSGWVAKVIEEGVVRAGDEIELIL
jgi:MOSC domain-containing protein YiiM